jgi:hypothetical protein
MNLDNADPQPFITCAAFKDIEVKGAIEQEKKAGMCDGSRRVVQSAIAGDNF